MRKMLTLLGICATLCLSIIMVTGCQNQTANVVGSRESAEKWVENVLPGYTLAGFNSASLDSDGDGYVTADITAQKKGTNELRLIRLQCPTQGIFLQVQHGSAAKFDSMPFESKF